MSAMKQLDPNLATLWIQFSGLPAALNKAKANGWLVFKTLIELDTRRGGAAAGTSAAAADAAAQAEAV